MTKKYLLLVIFSFSIVKSAEKIKMNFKNEELTKIIEVYSKASGQKFIVDPSVRGKISIYNQESVSREEAFNQLSSSLAVNGFAISKQGDTMVIKSARNIQRDLIEVSIERPSLKPQRMYTWIYNVKNVSAEKIFRDLRILLSKDGEASVLSDSNQIIFTDWASNLNRVADMMKEIDKQIDSSTAKVVSTFKKDVESKKNEQKNENSKE